MPTDPLNDRKLRNWWFRNRATRELPFEDVSVLGGGPFTSDDFDTFLRRQKIEVLFPDAYTEVLVVGRDGWSEKEFDRLLRRRSGKSLRVYSQEMFLAYLISGNDPLEDEDIAVRFGRGHPALELLQAMGFLWPTTDVRGFGPGHDGATAWRSEGFLKAKGYQVGYYGDPSRFRHRALTKAFGARVPRRFGSDYVENCGLPRSSLRLERMARSIARFCCMAKGRSRADLSQAIADWERDLKWLKRKYYDGHYRFTWPSTRVW